MILECLKCHRPYDVAKYSVGQKLRCTCGQIMVVPREAPHRHSVVTLHCSACGGDLEKGDAKCPFCGALVDLSSARLTAYCTKCCTTSREGARFCSGCGEPLTSTLDMPDEAEELCPRCRVTMRRRAMGAHKPLECPMCLGVFVEVEAFEELIRKQERRVGEVAAPGGPRKSVLTETQVTYIKCPVCDGMMNRQNYGRISGVIVDVCGQHGYWLDEGELEKIAAWVATGGLQKKYQIEMEEKRAEQSRKRLESELKGDEPERRGLAPAMESTRMGGSKSLSLLDLVTRLFD